jgi:hypothetical protein
LLANVGSDNKGNQAPLLKQSEGKLTMPSKSRNRKPKPKEADRPNYFDAFRKPPSTALPEPPTVRIAEIYSQLGSQLQQPQLQQPSAKSPSKSSSPLRAATEPFVETVSDDDSDGKEAPNPALSATKGSPPVHFCSFVQVIRDEAQEERVIETTKINRFLQRHAALTSLQRWSTPAASSLRNDTEDEYLRVYHRAAQDFQELQRDRLKESFFSHLSYTQLKHGVDAAHQLSSQCFDAAMDVDLESKDLVKLVKSMHHMSLEEEMQDVNPGKGKPRRNLFLTPSRLCLWYRLVIGDAKTKALMGANQDVHLLCQALQQLHNSVLDSRAVSPDGQPITSAGAATERDRRATSLEKRMLSDRTLAALVFGAVMVTGVLNLHEFDTEETGCLALISLNWVLRKTVALPFSVNLFENLGDTMAFLFAVEQTRANLHKNSHAVSTVTGRQFDFESLRVVHLFQPVIDLIVSSLSRTVTEFEKVLHERHTRASEERMSSAAKRYREVAIKEECIVCFDKDPNIALLCCGKAIHFDCLAKSVTSANTCPHCRANISNLSSRNGESEEESIIEGLALQQAIQQGIARSSSFRTAVQGALRIRREWGELSRYLIMEDDASLASTSSHPPALECLCCSNLAANDCVNQMCAHCCPAAGASYCERHAYEEEEDEEIQPVIVSGRARPSPPPASGRSRRGPPHSEPPECLLCHRLSAFSCPNHMCGGCCGRRGNLYCERHEFR